MNRNSKFVFIDEHDEIVESEVHENATDAEEWLKEQVENNHIRAEDAESYSVYELVRRDIEVAHTVTVTIS